MSNISIVSNPTAGITVVSIPPTEITVVAAGIGLQGIQGSQGIQGLQGIQGIQGLAGDLNYNHIQAVPDTMWTITHNLGKYPSVTIIDSANSLVIGEITYNSIFSLTVTFAAGFSGKAFLN